MGSVQGSLTGEAPTERLTGSAQRLDPLLDCLCLLSQLHGRPQSREALSAGLPLPDGKMVPALVARAAARAGLSARVVRTTLEQLAPTLFPAILLLNDDEACVLLGWSEADGARVLLPHSGGEQRWPRAELMRRYRGLTVYASPRFQFEARAPGVAPLQGRHWFWGTLWRCKHLYRDALVAAFLINLFALTIPFLTMLVYDRVVPNTAMETLWALAFGAMLVMLFDLAMRFLRGMIIDHASARIDISLSARIMEQVLGMRMESRPPSVGSFAANLRAFEHLRDFIASASVTALIDLPFVLLYLTVLALLVPILAIPPLVGVLIGAGYAIFAQRRMIDLAQLSYRASAQRNATLVESLIGLETVKALGAEGRMQQRWEQNTEYIANLNTRLRLLTSSTAHVSALLQQGVMLAILVLGVYAIKGGEASMGTLIAAMLLSGRALAPMAQLANLLGQYHAARTALQGLDQTMKLPVERPPESNFLHRPELTGAIEFREVTFNYPNREQHALRNVSLKIKPGEKVAVLGRVGSGKTTLEKLMLGLYQTQEGAVLLDGIDLRQLDPAELRRNIGFVPQDVTLFYGSLRDNIAMGDPQADDTAILAAAEIAGVTEFANAHPRGFDMLIDERGESLSGGQRQAIAIARALLRDPPVVLLDEPTSAMDHATEDKLKQRLRDCCAHKTLVIVTHRSSLLDLADRLIVLDGGRVVADGPKAKVIAQLSGQVPGGPTGAGAKP